MKESKVVSSLREAIRLSGLQDGMCVSFHHHLRNGDYVVNMVMEQISAMGIRDLTVNASALFDVHLPMLEHIKNGTVSRLLTNYMSAGLGRAISGGVMDQPVEFRTHGGRPRDIAGGETPIDVAFIAAPSSDTMGNCTGKVGKSACGSLGYAFPDAQYAKKVIVITDELVPYPLCGWSIPEIYVDYVVAVDAIGDPAGIVSGTTRMTRNPVAITIAQTAARVIASAGLLKDVFSFLTGAGDLIGVALVIAVSRGVSVIMSNTGLDMYILEKASEALQGTSSLLFTGCSYVVYLLLSVLIPSSSGLATVSMPIMGPLAQNLGLVPEIMVCVLSGACALVNGITPTSGTLMGAIAICRIEYTTWVKYIWKPLAMMLVLHIVILSVGMAVL